ncbi:MAG TPA: ribosome maturation factor RimM [Solirubrobacteraceae bacterium]
MAETEHWLRAGVVGRAHGLDGSFHVADPVAELLELDAEVRVGIERRRIVRLAGHEARPIVRLEGCEDRDAAEALRGQELQVARAEAPELEEDEWWATDLEGCAVRDGSREVGVVARLLALPSCEVLEVARSEPGTPDLLVPLVRDAVRDVDLDRRVIDVDLRFLGED